MPSERTLCLSRSEIRYISYRSDSRFRGGEPKVMIPDVSSALSSNLWGQPIKP